MTLGGIQRFSLIDYPGKMVAVLFFRGCNFKCPFCHNPELVRIGEEQQDVSTLHMPNVLTFLKRRRGKLDGVVLSGGEPTLQYNLHDLARTIKRFGFALKLDTNGSRPEVIEDLVTHGLLDYIAMDVKAPFEKYEICAGTAVDLQCISNSISIIASSSVEHEFRTTVVRPFLRFKDLIEIRRFVGENSPYIVQKCRTDVPLLDSGIAEYRQFTDLEIEHFQKQVNILSRIDRC